MKKINIQHEANINAKGKMNSKHCKPVICLETGEVFTSVIDAAEAIGAHHTNLSQHLNGKLRHIKGKHFCYLSRVNESLDAIITRLRETAAVESDAKKWQEYQAAQEAIRKAEEKRLEEERKAKAKRQAEIAKLTEKRANLNAKCNKLEAELHNAVAEMMEVEQALEALGVPMNTNEVVA